MQEFDQVSAGLPAREIESFLVVAEELHFGRAAERLYLSQGRVSQLVRGLERRLGARLFDRTSRTVCLTPFGAELRADLAPAYDSMSSALRHARRRAAVRPAVVRVGFQCSFYRYLSEAIAVFERSYPGSAVELVEIPLCDPFSLVLDGGADACISLLPASDPRLSVGPVFAEQHRCLIVGADHPVASRAGLDAEGLADLTLVSLAAGAPADWQEFHAPTRTPGGAAIAHRGEVRTVQEGITRASTGAVAFLLCQEAANYHLHPEIAAVPVTGMPPSRLGLVWPRGRATEGTRRFARTLASVVLPADAGPTETDYPC